MTIARHCGLGGDYVGRNHTYSALSRCNGNGSFKLTAAPNQLHRTHTINNGPRLDINRANAGTATPPGGTPPIAKSPGAAATNNADAAIAVVAAGTNPTFPNAKTDDKYHQKCLPANSPSTLLTVSRADGNGMVATKTGNDLDNRDKKSTAQVNVRKTDVTSPALPPSSNALAVASDKVAANATTTTTTTLGTIAEKLRRGTKRVLLFKHSTNASQLANGAQQQQQQQSKDKELRKLEKGNSVESNTISNSSLQEVDDDEFESAELAKYMGQINSEIR